MHKTAVVTGEYFYECRIARSSKRSKDMKLAARLFELSNDIVRRGTSD